MHIPFIAFVLFASIAAATAPAAAQLAGNPAAPSGAGTQAPPWNRYLTPRTLDADGIEELFERVARIGGVAHLPGGNYRIHRTIRLAGLGPIRIEGEGWGAYTNPRGDGFRAVPTRLLWTGPQGGTMFHLDGSAGMSFSHLQFHGGERAGRLFLLTSRPGFGTSNIRFTRALFTAADVAIQCGIDEKDFNNADLVYDEVMFFGVGTGLRTVNHQSLNHHFRSLSALHVGTVFDMERGGNLNVDGFAAGAFDLLLRVGYGGWNAGTYRFTAGRPEMNGRTRRHARLVEATPTDICRVVFEATQESMGPIDEKLPDNADEAAFKVGKGASVILRDHYHARPVLEQTGGLFRDIDGRWNGEDLGRIAASGNSSGRAGAGRVEIVRPSDATGVPLEEVRR